MAAPAIAPDTPIVVELKDRNMCLRAFALSAIPTLTDVIRKLPVEKDPVDGVYRGKVKFSLTLCEFTGLLSKAHGGAFDPCMYIILAANKLLTDKDYEDYLAMFRRPMDPAPFIRKKESSDSGAMFALVIRGVEDNSISGDTATDIFDFGEGAPRARYTEAVATQFPLPIEPGNKYEADTCAFAIPRNGDLCHTLVLKALLHPREDGKPWDPQTPEYLFQNVQLEIGNGIRDSSFLRTNNSVARARGMWPKSNDVPPVDPKVPWLITIPIMFAATYHYKKCYIPLIRLYEQEVRLLLNGISKAHPVEFALDITYVYLDSPLRGWFANVKSAPAPAPAPVSAWIPSWELGSVPAAAVSAGEEAFTPLANRCKCKHEACGFAMPVPMREVCVPMHNEVVINLPEDGDKYTVDLPFNRPTSGLMMTVSHRYYVPEGVAVGEMCPILSATLLLNNNVFAQGDFVDLTEFNWLKTGLIPPGGKTMLLLPFSREIGAKDYGDSFATCTANFSRVDKITLVLVPNKSLSWLRWEVVVASLAYNVQKDAGGRMGMKFAN